jgi:Outer membrane protein Omp28
MKTTKLLLYALLFLGLSFQSCDKVELPNTASFAYREDLYGAPVAPPTITTFTQRVLLEDFTGHQCGNCPQAHEVAATILATHEDRVTVVGIHAGSLAGVFGPYAMDWTTPDGQFYLLDQIGSDQLPTGRINRIGGANASLNFAVWSNTVNTALESTPKADLTLSAELQSNANHLNVHVRSKFAQAHTGNVKLVLMIVQGPIIAPQLNYAADPEFIEAYEHKHMLRATCTGSTGLTVATNPSAGQEEISNYTFDWNPNWVAEDVEIVALLTDGESGAVLNVNKLHLIP